MDYLTYFMDYIKKVLNLYLIHCLEVYLNTRDPMVITLVIKIMVYMDNLFIVIT